MGTTPESAITTFSNLVSTTTTHKSTHDPTPTPPKNSPELWSTGPHALPTEIIRMIFQFVFESCVSSEDGLQDDDAALWLDEDPQLPSLFPFALACVCLRWFRILKTIPVYWTRLIIVVDAITTSLDAARTTLSWAGNCLLKVVVTRHHSKTHDSERVGVDRTIQFLRPHFDQIWSLSFNVEHHSSIPALWREGGHARRLRVLTLLCRADASSSRWLPAGNSHEYDGKLKVPLLERVTLSDHFFKDPLMAHPRLAGWFNHVASLTICGDGASDRIAIPLFKFLTVIDLFLSLRALTIEDVCFDDNNSYPYLFVLRPAVLCLRRITSNTALRCILACAFADTRLHTDVTITDCTVHSFFDSNPGFSSTNLTLASMQPRTPIEDLVCRWNGVQLSVLGCPRVSRAFLERLHGNNAPAHLSRLRIVDCEELDFSAGDVITLVRSRATQAALALLMGGGGDSDGFAALTEVCIEGRGPVMSAERARWLAEHVERFSWDTVGRDGVRYVWDGSVGRLTTSSTGTH